MGVTALLVLLLGILNGIRSTILESATTLMTGHVNVGGFFKVTAGPGLPVVTHYPEILAVIRKEVPELDYVTQRGRGWAKLVSDTGSLQSGRRRHRHPPRARVPAGDPGEGGVARRARGARTPSSSSTSRPRSWASGSGDQLTLSAYTLRGVANTVDVRIVAIATQRGAAQQLEHLRPRRDAARRSTR